MQVTSLMPMTAERMMLTLYNKNIIMNLGWILGTKQSSIAAILVRLTYIRMMVFCKN